ncbi:MAG: diadenylate cyclase CdaA [Thermodesulfobacteriota bacterium]
MFWKIFSFGNVTAVVDILIVAVVLYWVMLMFRGTRAERMFWGLGVVILVRFISQRAELLTLHWIISNFLSSIIIFIIVVFQQDIRRALVHVGKPFSSGAVSGSAGLIDDVARAVVSMSRRRTGALIVLERAMDVSDFLGAGVDIDADVSRELLLSVFNTESPLHDGAVLIRDGRLARAGCILPLTERELGNSMGTRHRAAMGLAEETDAVIIVVSAQTGAVALVVDSKIHPDLPHEELAARLRELFSREESPGRSFIPWRVKA